MQGTQSGRVRCAGFEFDLKSGELRRDSRAIRLAEKPYRLLAILVEHAGEVVSREEIQHKLWPNDTIIDFEHGINSAIKFLRRAFDDSADHPKCIETIPRHGYRFIGLVEPINSPQPEASAKPQPDASGSGKTDQPQASLLGKKVSHYRVLELIGGGGMGLVYRAQDLKLGRAVAIKFLPEEMADDPIALQRFEREARAASALNNPHICTIYEFGDYEGQPFIVMELLKGETLRERLADSPDEKPLPLDQLLEVALHICDALAVAHQKGIIHRDVKPANIFLTESGLTKILDFGLAKPTAGASAMAGAADFETGPVDDEAYRKLGISWDPTATRTGVAIGSEGYMSPEQIRGEKLDARTDIFSFGLVLYEMATGQRAFRGETSPMVRKAILSEAPAPVGQLNSAIPAKLVTIIEKALQKDPERRWRTAEEMRAALDEISNKTVARALKRWIWLGIAALLSIAAVTFTLLYERSRRAVLLTGKDTVVLGDFANNTTDPVFADSLRLGLQVQLSQSPYLNFLPENEVVKILSSMGRHPEDKLTDPVVREVCQRSGSKAFISGSIANIGAEYVLTTKGVSCVTGRVLVQQQSEVADKEKILGALDAHASQLREKLGESPASVQRLNLPLTYVTTPSLEALQAYAQARQTPSPESSPALLKRAIELDPNFAIAYLGLYVIYGNSGHTAEAQPYADKAYALRDRTTDRMRLHIEARHYVLTGEIEKAVRVYEMLKSLYPQASGSYVGLTGVYGWLGQYDKALLNAREAYDREVDELTAFNLINSYLYAGKLEQADKLLQEAKAQKIASEDIGTLEYDLAFLHHSLGAMNAIASSPQPPYVQREILMRQASSQAYYGGFSASRKLTQRAVELSRQHGWHDEASEALLDASLREALVGHSIEAHKYITQGLAESRTRWRLSTAALAYAVSADVQPAQSLADDLAAQYSSDLLLTKCLLPTVRAYIELSHKNAAKAIDILQATVPYETGWYAVAIPFLPVYVRGQAYLALRDGIQAETMFRKIIENPGIVRQEQIGALAHVGLARAYALQGEIAKAQVEYEYFLNLWKDADSDIPICRQAKAEYAKLK